MFSSIGELVIHGRNGFVFETKEELFGYLAQWFDQFPNNESLEATKEEFSRNLKSFQNLRWTENWDKNALPVFQ